MGHKYMGHSIYLSLEFCGMVGIIPIIGRKIRMVAEGGQRVSLEMANNDDHGIPKSKTCE